MTLSSNCLITTCLFSVNLDGLSKIAEVFSKLDFPPWVFVVIFFFFFLYLVYARWLKHKEKGDKEKTKRYRMTVDGLREIIRSNNLLKAIRAISSVQEKTKVTSNYDFQIQKIQDEYLRYMNEQVSKELPNQVSSAESAPVCRPKRFKRINFSKKRSK